MTPIHHAFELRGWSEPMIVLVFWAAGLLAALVGISLR
jgi:phospho-N-acetylmuramoyl-pentapeptide-transferase